MKLTMHYKHQGVPVEVMLESEVLKPCRACKLLQYIVARLDAAVDKALPKSHGERGCVAGESTQPRLTAAAQPPFTAESEP
ncbi:MAG: hypothetical protein QMD10_09920 [Desulfitobacteriaceae bacterium]|nr:hypothetical protein [Desulfitobacteriaceae bacterium]